MWKEKMNKNSMCYWYPIVKQLQCLNMPKTVFVKDSLYRVGQEAEKMGYPVFIRTDLCSGKHDWENSCYVDHPDKLEKNLLKVIESNIRWNMLGIDHEAIVIREFLDLETRFTAFDGHMPINKERRVFIKDGKMLCHHPYWPKTAFNNHPARMADVFDWENQLMNMNYLSEQELGVIKYYADQVGMLLPEFWSIDFAKGKNGKWYLLDMALGENSYHEKGCSMVA